MTEAPWGEYGRQRKPITPRQLATPAQAVRDRVGHNSGKRDEHTEGLSACPIREHLAQIPLRIRHNATRQGKPPLLAIFYPPQPPQMWRIEKPQKARQTASCGVVADGPPIPVQEAENDGCGMTLEDLDRMGGESDDDGFAEFDDWIRPS